MLRTIIAKPIAGPGRELSLLWDPQAGVIGGPDGERVLYELERSGAWWLGVHAFYPVDQARTSAAHLAALLYLMGYLPPVDIAVQLGGPEILPDDTPPGALE